ncbi:protein of unknown function [Clostridium beijerinckii]|nr:protein of unknown function [Clostridium beijerinckii]
MKSLLNNKLKNTKENLKTTKFSFVFFMLLMYIITYLEL